MDILAVAFSPPQFFFLLLLLRAVLLPLLALLASALTSGLVLLPGVCLVQPAPLVPAVVLFFLCLLAMISLRVSPSSLLPSSFVP